MDTVKPLTTSVKLKRKEHTLVREIADAEGRTLSGIVTLALRMYAARKQPAVLKRVYGETA